MGRASLPTTLKNETGTGAKAHSSASGGIISQNAAKDELKSLSKEYDVEQFLKDREDILAKDARYGKTRFSESRIEDNGGVGGWEYKRTPAGYDKNYNADFLTAKADVAKIRGGKIDEQGSKIEQARVKREVVKGEAPGQHPGANFANESAPLAKDSQGLAFSPYKDDAQRVAQTNNDIILQNSAKGGAA